ncbi:MAG: hypothetical protein Q7T79_00480 [bacterium]|nr:hypothetical protein [bacterium]
MNSCPYCEEFKDGFSSEYGNRILYESKNFVVFPSLGQIVEGYLLIASKKHYIAIGEIPSKFYFELNAVCQKVRKILSENYESPLFFEHGPISSIKKGGCCIEHAHFHAVPVKIDILEDLSKNFKYKNIKSFDSLKKQFRKEIPCFYYESNFGEKYLFEIQEVVPSQYIRRLIAYKIGKHERWDWRACMGLDELKRTISKLKNKF